MATTSPPQPQSPTSSHSNPNSIYPASYAAFFAPRTHKFETVDFRLPASPANLLSVFPASSEQARSHRRIAGLLGLLVGLVFALIGFSVDQLTRGLTFAVYRAVDPLLRDRLFWPALLLFVALSCLFVLVAACMVVYIAPLGAGSGIPELKSYLNGVRIPGFLALNSLFVKAVGICFSISSGLICGRQGPMIHAGAITGAGLSQMATSRFGWRMNKKLMRFLRTEMWKRDFCAVGAAVGVAVAFGSPMGAWMWVYEEACTHWTWDLGIITLGGCLVGAVVVRVLNYVAAGLPGGGFGAFTLTQFGKLVTPFGGTVFPLKDVPGFLLLGLLGGVAGALLPLINKRITLFRYKRVTSPVPRILEAVAIGLLTAVLRMVIPRLANDCRPVDEDLKSVLASAPLGDYSRFMCEEGEFSGWAAVLYNPTDTVVRGLLFAKSPELFPAAGVSIALAYYFVFIVWTYGIAVPAGVFFPGFLLGSVYGRLVGIIVQAMFPGRTDVSLTGYAFIGSISALAGLTRTISVAVIALEATGGNDASFAAVLVAIVAKLVGDFFYTKGIYDLHIDLKGIPFLSSNVPKVEIYAKLRVSDLMESSVIGVRRLSRISGLMRMLGTNDHHAFPVFVKLASDKNWTDKKVEGDDAEDFEDDMSRSETSVMEEEMDKNRSGNWQTDHQPRSQIITASHAGMQAKIYGDGATRLVQMTERGEVHVIAETPKGRNRHWIGPKHAPLRSVPSGSEESRSGSGSGDAKDEREVGNDVPDYELMGTIDRGTLLAVIKHECDREEGLRDKAEMDREDYDAAWPNGARLKGRGEELVMERVRRLGLEDRVVDLSFHIDPDPLLMTDRARSMAAYKLFRGTGARHILVTNMRSGNVCGIVTRKDVLPGSVQEVANRLQDVSTE